MKAVKLKDNIYAEAERVSKIQGIKVEELIPQALKQGLNVLNGVFLDSCGISCSLHTIAKRLCRQNFSPLQGEVRWGGF